jgi:hypothetical protein
MEAADASAVEDDATRGDLVTASVSLPGDSNGDGNGGEKAVDPRTAYIAQLRKEAAGARASRPLPAPQKSLRTRGEGAARRQPALR